MRALIKQYILPIIFILMGFSLFFLYTSPTYSQVQEVQQENADYEEAINRADELIALRDKLLTKYNSIESQNLENLQKMVPSHIDNVRLIIEIDRIASNYGLQISQAELIRGTQAQEENDNSEYQSVNMQFRVEASYEEFLRFVRDLERSLRIVDVTQVTFNASENDLQQFNVTLKTYWIPANSQG